jgi:hypothetical protein
MFCPKCYIEFVDGYAECRDCHIPLVAKRPKRIGRRIGKAVLGLLLAIASAAVLATIYVMIPEGIWYPRIILWLPATGVAAGLFQAATGLTIFELNYEFPRMSPAERFVVVATLLIVLFAALGSFIWCTTRQ